MDEVSFRDEEGAHCLLWQFKGLMKIVPLPGFGMYNTANFRPSTNKK